MTLQNDLKGLKGTTLSKLDALLEFLCVLNLTEAGKNGSWHQSSSFSALFMVNISWRFENKENSMPRVISVSDFEIFEETTVKTFI